MCVCVCVCIQCAVSGSNYERLLEKGRDEKITKIEIFFFGFPRISGLHHFPNLTTLCIVNQPIRSLAGLESCDQLTELWVCETPLKVRMQPINLYAEAVNFYVRAVKFITKAVNFPGYAGCGVLPWADETLPVLEPD